jgi:hypothetical protein
MHRQRISLRILLRVAAATRPPTLSLLDDRIGFATFDFDFYAFSGAQVSWAYRWDGTGHSGTFGPAVDSDGISYWCMTNGDIYRTYKIALDENGGSLKWSDQLKMGHPTATNMQSDPTKCCTHARRMGFLPACELH